MEIFSLKSENETIHVHHNGKFVSLLLLKFSTNEPLIQDSDSCRSRNGSCKHNYEKKIVLLKIIIYNKCHGNTVL